MQMKDVQEAIKVYYEYANRHQWLPGDSRRAIEEACLIDNKELFQIPEMKLFEDYRKKKVIEGAMVVYNETAYILFMATNSKLDWITNFIFFKKRIPYNNVRNKKIRVHSGYMKQYTLNSIRTEILLWLADHKDAKKVVVTGYSMGGGLAPICAVDMAYNFPDKEVKCISFSGPRIGNGAFIKSLERRADSVHFSYGNDIVVRVPPRIFGFLHITKKYVYGEKKWWKLSAKDHMPHNLFIPIMKEDPNDNR